MADSRVAISADVDIVTARQTGRALCARLGFRSAETALVVTAISEIARNIVNYALRGEMEIGEVQEGNLRGIRIAARDAGPGIPDINLAMQDGYSTGKSLGLGLPGARRMMDQFEIASEVGKGTSIVMTKWLGR